MSLRIAIEPDLVTHANGERQSFSERWVQLARDHDIEVVPVDVYARDAISQVTGCHAFMWRCTASAHQRLYAKRFLYAIEAGKGLSVFPSLKSSWYFEDKIAQHYFFSSCGIPMPATRVFWTRSAAARFCACANYPFVLKLTSGYQASNVRLVRNQSDALFYVDQLFGPGVVSLAYRPAPRPRLLLRRLRAAWSRAQGNNPDGPTVDAETHHGYFYVQEFLPDNPFSIRVTVIGRRAFVFRLFNRPNDFRASLIKGNIDWDPAKVEDEAVRLAWNVAWQLDAQTIAADIIYRGSHPVVVELTLNYASWAVRDCPGHWALQGTPDSGALVWREGHMEPADAIFEDFLAEIRSRNAAMGDGAAVGCGQP